VPQADLRGKTAGSFFFQTHQSIKCRYSNLYPAGTKKPSGHGLLAGLSHRSQLFGALAGDFLATHTRSVLDAIKETFK
jgi:hypothetical protein